MKRLIILVDLDSTVVDLVGALLDTFNAEEAEDGQELRAEDLTSWDFREAYPEHGEKLLAYMQRPQWFEHLQPMAGAIEALMDLSHDHDIVVCSSPMAGPESAADKMRWFARELPFLPDKNIVLTSQKHRVVGDVFIDDSVDQAQRYRDAWPKARIVGVRWPYNEGYDRKGPFDLLAADHANPEEAWRTIASAVRGYAKR